MPEEFPWGHGGLAARSLSPTVRCNEPHTQGLHDRPLVGGNPQAAGSQSLFRHTRRKPLVSRTKLEKGAIRGPKYHRARAARRASYYYNQRPSGPPARPSTERAFTASDRQKGDGTDAKPCGPRPAGNLALPAATGGRSLKHRASPVPPPHPATARFAQAADPQAPRQPGSPTSQYAWLIPSNCWG